jgi:hypothetical protein
MLIPRTSITEVFSASSVAVFEVGEHEDGTGDSARQAVPAAISAHADLVAMMRKLDDTGRLRLPVEVAACAVEAGAVGVTLQLIRTNCASDDPAVAIVRDAVIGSARPYGNTPASPQLAATPLRGELQHSPVATLRASETALLHDWLDALVDAVP